MVCVDFVNALKFQRVFDRWMWSCSSEIELAEVAGHKNFASALFRISTDGHCSRRDLALTESFHSTHFALSLVDKVNVDHSCTK